MIGTHEFTLTDKYRQVNTTVGFLDLMKDLYFPSAREPEEIVLPEMNFLTVEGMGAPESSGFQEAVRSLYGVTFTLKMGLKFGKLVQAPEYYDYKVPPLEGLWWQGNNKMIDMNNKDSWEWRLMIMLPNFITRELHEQAVSQAKAKHPEVPYGKVRMEAFEEGKSIQMLHIGPYADEYHTVDRLLDYAQEHEYIITGKHHEIYMSDPRRTPSEKLKTVLRYAVR